MIQKTKLLWPNKTILFIGSHDSYITQSLDPLLYDKWLVKLVGGGKAPPGAGHLPNSSQLAGNEKEDDPVTTPPRGGKITGAQYWARELFDQMNAINWAWDGLMHDNFWEGNDGSPHYWDKLDFNRNNLSDTDVDGFTKDEVLEFYRQSVAGMLKAFIVWFTQRRGKRPYICVNPGDVNSRREENDPFISLRMAEDPNYNLSWWTILSALYHHQEGVGLGHAPLGMGIDVKTGGFHNMELSYTSYRQDNTFRTNVTPTTTPDTKRFINVKNSQNGFGYFRFFATTMWLYEGWIQRCAGEHEYTWWYDEYESDLGLAISDVARIATLGRPGETTPTWPYDPDAGDQINLYGAFFIRFFQKGCIVCYVPRQKYMTTAKLTRTHIDQACDQLGIPRRNVYRFKGTQAPIQLYVGASQVKSEQPDSAWGRETNGIWSETIQSDWPNSGSHLGVFGKQAWYKQVPASPDGSWFRLHFIVPKNGDYSLWYKLPVQGYVPAPGYAKNIFKSGSVTLEPAITVTVRHDNGVGTPTTTNVTGLNLQTLATSLSLGSFPFIAGTGYWIEVKGDVGTANNYVVVDGLYIEAEDLAFNDGTELTDANPVYLFGGISSMKNYVTDGGDAYNAGVTGDGIVLKYQADMKSDIGSVVANYPVHDTDPGVKEADYAPSYSTWIDKRDDSNAKDQPYPPDRTNDNPYWAFSTPGIEQYVCEGYGYRQVAAGTAGAKAKYNFHVKLTGTYKVYEWHGWIGKTATPAQQNAAVVWDLKLNGSPGGSPSSGTINQTANYGQWNLVSTISASIGDDLLFTLDAAATSGGGNVISDAVKFELQ